MERATVATDGWGGRSHNDGDSALAAMLLRIVDCGLIGIICIAPYFFGGRHDLGRLVFVSLVAVIAVAWFLYQATQREGAWPRTWAYAILFFAAALLTLQIVPLPEEWIAALSPNIVRLLPLWATSGDAASLGTWRTLSLNPHETTKSLAMLLSYCMLFVVVAGRLRTVADVARIQKCIGAAAVLMAGFGILQYFTSGGRYFWFFEHPFRSSATHLSGAFINRNHFAHFLVLGLGPLVAWLLQLLAEPHRVALYHAPRFTAAQRFGAWILAAAMVLVTVAILWSHSRGGAAAMLVAGTGLTAIYMYRRLVDSRFVYGLVGLTAAVVALLSVYGYDRVVQRLDDFAECSFDEMDRGGARQKIWAANVAAIKAFPLTGSGAGSHREVAAVYLREASTKSYSHAENGFLQVTTENGAGGAILLLAGIAVVGAWCIRCFFSLQNAIEVRLFGAAAAGLAASVAHSFVDFVWYIPACMSITVVLAACVFRLSQFARGAKNGAVGVRVFRRGRWLELAAAAVMVGAWTVHTYFGPAIAAVHWDRYRRASVADAQLAQESVEQFVAGEDVPSQEARRLLSKSMLRHLEAAVYWDPHFAEAHERLADRYVTDFELQMDDNANLMDVAQIRATARESGFTSIEQLDDWMIRAFGSESKQLRQALAHARWALVLSPLKAEAYLQLADLSFLDLAPIAAQDASITQALRIRPYDRNVLATAGRQALFKTQIDVAIEYWSKCFHTPGRHQQEIVYLLVSNGMPAAEFLAHFQPDWRTMRLVWSQYRSTGVPQQLEAVLNYAAKEAEKETATPGGVAHAYIWFWQSTFYDDLKRPDEALDCLQRAYVCDPHQYSTRRALATKLRDAGRLTEAEPHIRWCLARRPADKALSAALVDISKARLAQRETNKSP